MATTSGSNALKPDTESEGAAEPSMEEILASIRQIISEDEADEDGLSERERYTHPDDASNSNENQMQVNPIAASAGRQPVTDVESDDKAASGLKMEALAARRAHEGLTPVVAVPVQEKPVLAERPPIPRFVQASAAPPAVAAEASPSVQSAALENESAVNSLSRMLLQDRKEDIEAMLGDMMRPVVRKWLADNLPTLVEKLVREEIERASRGRTA